MNGAHWHLLINHIPILFPAAGIAVYVISFIFPNVVMRRAAYFLFILAAVSAYPAMETGEGAEHLVKPLPGFDKKMIHDHEETAETFSVLCYVLGVLSLIALWAGWKNKSFAGIMGWLTALCAAVIMFFAYRTGVSGGEIRHTEIRCDFQAPAQDPGSGGEEHHEE